jgi:hypothetical protein
LEGYTSGISSARFGPDTRDFLATASYDTTVRIWQGFGPGVTPEGPIVLRGHRVLVTAVDFCAIPGSNQCYSIDEQGDLKVWDLNSRACVKTIHVKTNISAKHSGFSANPLRARPNSQSTVAVALDNTLVLLDVDACPDQAVSSETSSMRTVPTKHEKRIIQIDWSPDGAYLATASEDMVCVWDAATLKILQTQSLQTDKIASCCFIPDPTSATPSSSHIVFGAYESVYIRRFRNSTTHVSSSNVQERPIAVASIQNGTICALAATLASADDNTSRQVIRLASGSSHKDANLNIWQVADDI